MNQHDCSREDDAVTDVLVWTIRAILPHEELAALVTVLSDKERQKAMRFRRAADRNQYIVAHGRLREILSAELAIPASEVALSSNENGKPHAVLDQDESPIEFSLSHSGDVALVAVSRTGAVGVDIERRYRSLVGTAGSSAPCLP